MTLWIIPCKRKKDILAVVKTSWWDSIAQFHDLWMFVDSLLWFDDKPQKGCSQCEKWKTNLEQRKTMKTDLEKWKLTWNYENQPGTMKNHENRPGTMKNQPGTMKNHKNQPETMKNRPGTMKNHENRPGTMKSHENQPGTMKNHSGTIYTEAQRHSLRKWWFFVTYAGSQLTFMNEKVKIFRHLRGVTTDLLDV